MAGIAIDLEGLKEIFDDYNENSSHPVRGHHVFGHERADGSKVRISVDTFERTASIGISTHPQTTSARLRFRNCTDVRILDQDQKILEILSEDPRARCYTSLNGSQIFDVSVPSDDNARA